MTEYQKGQGPRDLMTEVEGALADIDYSVKRSRYERIQEKILRWMLARLKKIV